MTITELKEKLQEEVKRANAYRNPYSEGPFGMLGASNDYIRGGKDALNGVIKLLEEMEKTPPDPDGIFGDRFFN